MSGLKKRAAEMRRGYEINQLPATHDFS